MFGDNNMAIFLEWSVYSKVPCCNALLEGSHTYRKNFYTCGVGFRHGIFFVEYDRWTIERCIINFAAEVHVADPHER